MAGVSSNPAAADAVDRTLAALADPARRSVVDHLRKRPRRAGELADALQMSAPRMSQHLKVLRDGGLVEDVGLTADARVRVYRLCPEPFTRLRRWLDEVEAFWTEELAAFQAHAERTRGKRRP
jgi:DNA-binding transcriptional ArsR family regulator